MLVDSSKLDDIAQRVADRIGEKYGVTGDTIHAAFPEKGKDNYGLSRKKTDSGSRPDSSLRTIADQLRIEAAARLEAAVGKAKLSPDRGPSDADESGRTKNSDNDRRGVDGLDGARAAYGQPTEGSVGVDAIHYLDSSMYGTGMRGGRRSNWVVKRYIINSH